MFKGICCFDAKHSVKWILFLGSYMLIISGCAHLASTTAKNGVEEARKPSEAILSDEYETICFPSVSPITDFDATNPYKYVSSPAVDGKKFKYLGHLGRRDNSYGVLLIETHVEDEVYKTKVDPKNERNVYEQIVKIGDYSLAMMPSKTSTHSREVWLYEGDLSSKSGENQHLYFICRMVW